MKKKDSPLSETRSEVIWRYLTRMSRETRGSIDTYSVDVLSIWLQRVPEDVRHGDFSDRGDVFAQVKANSQKISRWMNPQVSARPSLDVEEALVLALPEPYRMDCLRELAARIGGLFLPIPQADTPALEDAAALVRECGATLTDLAPVLEDGRIDARDSAESLVRVKRDLLAVQSAVAALMQRVDTALCEQAAAEPRVTQIDSRRA